MSSRPTKDKSQRQVATPKDFAIKKENIQHAQNRKPCPIPSPSINLSSVCLLFLQHKFNNVLILIYIETRLEVTQKTLILRWQERFGAQTHHDVWEIATSCRVGYVSQQFKWKMYQRCQTAYCYDWAIYHFLFSVTALVSNDYISNLSNWVVQCSILPLISGHDITMQHCFYIGGSLV